MPNAMAWANQPLVGLLGRDRFDMSGTSLQDTTAVSLSLVSHTNAGKTTLARTLLGRDVGEVRDAPHVTDFADVFTMIETPAGESLRLWDTPGFGDSLRLLRRLRLAGQPLGWFLTQVWDRWRDRPFWASQQALRNVRDEADVMLYLVNAAEAPEAAAYVDPEMQILAWIDKPVIVLLNQLGPPREPAEEAAELQRWRDHLARHPKMASILSFDAFARCWVQEFGLLAAIGTALPPGEQRSRMSRLQAAWQARRWATFDAAMASLAASLGRLASDVEVVPEQGSGGRVAAGFGRVGAAIRAAVGAGAGAPDRTPAALARDALAGRLAREVQTNTAELIALYGLEGRAEAEILSRLASQFEMRSRLDEGKAALWGGALTGALAGLKADILSGGLTMGGGLLAGGVVGALGAAGLARGVNLVRGTEQSWVAWNADALNALLAAALLRYLAVAHFGRGRGDWATGEAPAHWQQVVDEAMAPEQEALRACWTTFGGIGRHENGESVWPISKFKAMRKQKSPQAREAAPRPAQTPAPRLEPLVRRAGLRALQTLYPDVTELRSSG